MLKEARHEKLHPVCFHSNGILENVKLEGQSKSVVARVGGGGGWEGWEWQREVTGKGSGTGVIMEVLCLYRGSV